MPVVFTSTMATIGTGKEADHVSVDTTIHDACRATPHTTYGMTKACCELLLADYSRKGYVDGRGQTGSHTHTSIPTPCAHDRALPHSPAPSHALLRDILSPSRAFSHFPFSYSQLVHSQVCDFQQSSSGQERPTPPRLAASRR